MAKLKASLGFIDLAREMIPEPIKLASWWSYRALDFRKSNRGLRLDHIRSDGEAESQPRLHRPRPRDDPGADQAGLLVELPGARFQEVQPGPAPRPHQIGWRS